MSLEDIIRTVRTLFNPLHQLESVRFVRAHINNKLPSYNDFVGLMDIGSVLRNTKPDHSESIGNYAGINQGRLEELAKKAIFEFSEKMGEGVDEKKPVSLDITDISVFNSHSKPIRIRANAYENEQMGVEFYVKQFELNRLIGLLLTELICGYRYGFQYKHGEIILEGKQSGEHLGLERAYSTDSHFSKWKEHAVDKEGNYILLRDNVIYKATGVPEIATEQYQRELFRFLHFVEFLEINDMTTHPENWTLREVQRDEEVAGYMICPIDFGEIFGEGELRNPYVRDLIGLLAGLIHLEDDERKDRLNSLYNESLTSFQRLLKVNSHKINYFADKTKGFVYDNGRRQIDLGSYLSKRFDEYVHKPKEDIF